MNYSSQLVSAFARTFVLHLTIALASIASTTIFSISAVAIEPPATENVSEPDARQATSVEYEKAVVHASEPSNLSADDALAMLRRGNRRFVQGRSKHPHENVSYRRSLTAGQKPFATILGCSDSRVAPELIFDEGLGDLFVIRVAGNIVDDDVTASVEYAVEHLQTNLIVVLGHEGCGAVTAAMASGENHPHELGSLVRHIHDNIAEHHDGEPDVDSSTPLADAVAKNALCGCRELASRTDLCRCMEGKCVRVVAAIYELETGKVRWLDDEPSQDETK